MVTILMLALGCAIHAQPAPDGDNSTYEPANCGGCGDLNQDGVCDGADVEVFYRLWQAGEIDETCDGICDDKDVLAFWRAWEDNTCDRLMQVGCIDCTGCWWCLASPGSVKTSDYQCLFEWQDCYWDAYTGWVIGELTEEERDASMRACLAQYEACLAELAIQHAIELFTP